LKGWNNYLETTKNESKFYSGIKSQHTAVRECSLSSSKESIVFQFAIQNYKD